MFTEKIVTETGLYQAIGKGCNVKKYSISLNKLRKNLKKAIAVTAIIGIATCLFPADAQAQVRRFFQVSGIGVSAEEGDPEFFTISAGTSDIFVGLGIFAVEDVNSLDTEGEFPGAIQDFRVNAANDDNLDLFFPSGTLRSSRLTIDPITGNFPGLSFGYQAITDNNFPFAAFNNDGLRYDFTFDNRSETLTLFIPSNDSSVINSLSELLFFFGSIGEVQGVVSYPDVGIEQRFLVTDFPRRDPVIFYSVAGILFDDDPFFSRLDFSVGTSDVLISSSLAIGVEDVNSLDSKGEFPGAIRELRVDTDDDNLDLFLISGTLRTSRLTIDPTTGNFPGLSFGYQDITDDNFLYAAFNNDGLRYDFTFNNRSETLTLFIPSNDSSQINSLLDLFDFLSALEGVQGVVSYPDIGIEQRLLVTGAQRVVNIPEPTATVSLLGVGAIGAVSLLKRNKRLRKAV